MKAIIRHRFVLGGAFLLTSAGLGLATFLLERAGPPTTEEQLPDARQPQTTSSLSSQPPSQSSPERSPRRLAADAARDVSAPAGPLSFERGGRRIVGVEGVGIALAGIVIDASTGRPIAGAEVVAAQREASTQRKSRADSSGRFALSLPPGAIVDVKARAEGYKSASRSNLPVDRQKSPVLFQLSPLLALDGRVTDLRGAPVEGAAVWISGKRKFGPVWSDSDGSFRIEKISPQGEYALLAAHSSYRLKKPLTVAVPQQGGQATVVMLLTPREQLGRIQGRVSDAAGAPITEATLNLVLDQTDSQPPFFETVRLTETSPRGEYEFVRVRSARYSILCDAPGYSASPDQLQQWVVIEPGRLEARLDFVLDPVVGLAGRVTDEEGAPVARARVLVRPSEGPGSGTLSDEAGRFQLPDLAPGAFELSVAHGEYVSFSRALTAPQEQDLEIVLSRGVSLSGVARNSQGHPIEGFTLRFERLPHGKPAKSSRQSAPGGAFQVRGLARGAYRLTLSVEGGKSFGGTLDLQRDERVRLVADESASTLEVRVLP